MPLSVPLTVLICFGFLAGCADSEPESTSTQRHSLSSDPAGCTVQISKFNYENPGTDTAEYLELLVIPQLVADAGTLTFASCGIESLELFNGGSACQSYRSIPLREAPIPDSGLLGVCAEDSDLAAACAITTAGSSALRNGWLQNGPDDGLRIIGAAGVIAEYVYDRIATGCATSGSRVLPTETGALPGSGEDDVAVLCEGQYSLVSASGVSPGAEYSCNAAESLPSVDVSTTALAGASGLASSGFPGVGVSANGSQASSSGVVQGVGGANGAALDGAAGRLPALPSGTPFGSARVVGEITTSVPTHVAVMPVDAGAETASPLQVREQGAELSGPPDALSCVVGTRGLASPAARERSWLFLLASLLALACLRR